uniref:Uncharacterized protein n=1 Tax=Oryza brachyantha TaxID=4533 RepID=J3M0C5_ORYBR
MIVMEDDLAGDGFTQSDLEAAKLLMQLRGSGGRQDNNAGAVPTEQDDEDDDYQWLDARKFPRYRSLSEL